MPGFSSVTELLDQFVLPRITDIGEELLDQDGNLKMTSTWIVDKGVELCFGYDRLGIPFSHMNIIVNTTFLNPCFPILSQYPDAYQGLTKNVRWNSIDSLVAQGEVTELMPIAFISLTSCFRGRDPTDRVNLAEVLEKMNYPDTRQRIIIILSSELDAERKQQEIEDAIRIINTKFKVINLEEFTISDRGGGFCGFIATF